jgi:predicted Holliday junction resolvase-like endonuclease
METVILILEIVILLVAIANYRDAKHLQNKIAENLPALTAKLNKGGDALQKSIDENKR